MWKTLKAVSCVVVALVALLLVLPVDARQSVYYGSGSSYTNLFQGTNLLEMRNGVNFQSMLLYNTFTDASNYERVRVGFDGTGTVQLQTESAGTGNTSKAINIQTGSASVLIGTVGTTRLTVRSDGILTVGAVAFASLGTPANGSYVYCNDCTIAAVCAGAGTGAFAKRLNATWVCN